MAYEKHVATLGHIKKRSKTEDIKNEDLSYQNKTPERNVEELEMCSNPVFGEFDPEEFEVLDEVGEEDDTHVEVPPGNMFNSSSTVNQNFSILTDNAKPYLGQDELA